MKHRLLKSASHSWKLYAPVIITNWHRVLKSSSRSWKLYAPVIFINLIGSTYSLRLAMPIWRHVTSTSFLFWKSLLEKKTFLLNEKNKTAVYKFFHALDKRFFELGVLNLIKGCVNQCVCTNYVSVVII